MAFSKFLDDLRRTWCLTAFTAEDTKNTEIFYGLLCSLC